jgi:CMP-N,N'-diacetyllegionaminic acid synthase
MYEGKTFLAIITARGGSTGLPRKNIKHLAGKPLIAWTIEEAKKSKCLDRIILSSEDTEIINVAKSFGCEVPFVRPSALAKDDTPGIDPVIHALKTLPEKYDFVVLLQPTSPLRKEHHIDEAIEMLDHYRAESLVSICEAKESPYWMFNLNTDNTLTSILPMVNISRRQDLPQCYILNGALYIASFHQILTEQKFINDNTIGYHMAQNSSIDIDNMLDFEIAEKLLMRSL